MPLRPAEDTPSACQAVHLDKDDLTEALRAVEHVYQVAWTLADRGRVDFEAFRPITRALRILRRYRDEVRDRAA